MDFGNKMKSLIENIGITQKEFAERVEMDYSHANKFFSGRKPNMEFIHKVVQVFPQVDLKWLLFSESDKPVFTGVSEPIMKYETKKAQDIIRKMEENLKEFKTLLAQN